MTNSHDTLAALYTAWLKKQDKNPKEGAALVGCSVSVSYEYASGLSVPTSTRIRDFAVKIGEDPERLAKIAHRDRPLCRRRKKALHVPRRTKAGAA